MLTEWIRFWSGAPAFSVYGKTRLETHWRVLDVYATPRRNCDSRWPLWRGSATCWTSRLVAVGCDFAAELLADQRTWLASRDQPVSVIGGSLCNLAARVQAGLSIRPSEVEVMAHEIGHSGQALRFRWLYLPIVAPVTIFGEGPCWWNCFENEASAQGLFGGIVPGTLHPLFRPGEGRIVPKVDPALALTRMCD